MTYLVKSPTMESTEAEHRTYDANTGSNKVDSSGSGRNDASRDEHNPSTGNARFDSNSSGEHAETGAGYDHFEYGSKAGLGSVSRNIAENSGFNAYKASNSDPFGIYAQAKRMQEEKDNARVAATNDQRPARRQRYESGTGFEGEKHGLGSQVHNCQPHHSHVAKGMERDFGRSENTSGKAPSFFNPIPFDQPEPLNITANVSGRQPNSINSTPLNDVKPLQMTDKNEHCAHDNRHRQPFTHGTYRQASIETASENGSLSSDFTNARPFIKNRVVEQSRKRALEESDDDEYEEVSETTGAGEEDWLFVHPKGSGPFYAPNIAHHGSRIADGVRQFEAVDVDTDNSPAVGQDNNPAYFPNSGVLLNKARNSGVALPWASNKTPVANQPKVTGHAALLKRGVDPKTKKKVLKRASGANDPENITIVNLRDMDKMRFEEIAAHLNADRIKKGLNPSLTTCGVNGRYNRTAPVLYRAQGMHFVPPAERRRLKKAGLPQGNGSDEVAQVWTPQMDVQLVLASKEYDQEKWATVAELVSERMGVKVDETQCAVRFTTL